MTNYQLQGTEGCYESARRPGSGTGCGCGDDRAARPLAGPRRVCRRVFAGRLARRTGSRGAGRHGGGDYYAMADFVAAIVAGSAPRVGITRRWI
jgi:hypothetical protein